MIFIFLIANNHRIHVPERRPWHLRCLVKRGMVIIAQERSTAKLEARTRSLRRRPATIRIGYVPLMDAAPLIAADALGYFEQTGLRVSLEEELGWGSIRERIVYGELDAAHAPGGLLFSILLGIDAPPRSVQTDLVLNLQGNAITLSRRVWQKGVTDAESLRMMIRSEAPHKPKFAVVSPYSSHIFLLQKWLRTAGIDPEADVRTTILPPPLVVEHMQEGYIDGFCAGEPWNSVAALGGDGWIAATSASLAPGHPEKILVCMYTRDGWQVSGGVCSSAEGRSCRMPILRVPC
ncbi:MAG: ABC transporter substrate-binding protein [Verrucomicrobia bacterium]|nr:ABC transporter substrate-binding protein [Verrucomicrobiota bacterium]